MKFQNLLFFKVTVSRVVDGTTCCRWSPQIVHLTLLTLFGVA